MRLYNPDKSSWGVASFRISSGTVWIVRLNGAMENCEALSLQMTRVSEVSHMPVAWY